MDDIIARLGRATGPDRELNAAINAAVVQGWPVELRDGQAWAYFHHADDKEPRWHYLFSDEGAGLTIGYPNYMRSIDAALTLVPEGWEWSLCYQQEKYRAEMGDPSLMIEAEADTAALALAEVALKAQRYVQRANAPVPTEG